MAMLTCGSCHGLTPDGASITCLHCEAALTIPPRWARKLAWVFGPVGAVLLAACYGPSGRYRNEPMAPNGSSAVDRDGDGSYASPTTANGDCDDNDPTRYPGAADPVGDGIDQNCDGVDGWKDPSVVVQPQNATGDATTTTPAPAPSAP